MTETSAVIRIEGIDLLILSIVVLFVGEFAKAKLRVLRDYNIPSAVIGGLFCSLVVAGFHGVATFQIEFGSTLRDMLLLAFFSTVGLAVKLGNLREDMKAILVLLVVASSVLIFQNMAGSAVATAVGIHPAYGLLAGSVSFVGGHGTGVAWSEIFAARFGLPNAENGALAFATFGLVFGGLVGGPLARRLILKHNLKSDVSEAASQGGHIPLTDAARKQGPIAFHAMLHAIFLVALCISVAVIARPWIAEAGLTIPDFVIALVSGAILTNLIDGFKIRLNVSAIGLVSEVSLQIFLAISIMSIDLGLLVGAAGPVLTVLVLQVVLMIAFAYFIVFPVMGRDYDASVICAGFVGFGLGATPVGLANMRAVTTEHGVSAKSFIVVPIVGAFLVDIVNTLIIQFYLASPMFN